MSYEGIPKCQDQETKRKEVELFHIEGVTARFQPGLDFELGKINYKEHHSAIWWNWIVDCIYVCMHACMLNCFSRVQLCVTLWAAARQAPLSMGFSRQDYWSGLPCPPPGDLPDPGIEHASLNAYLHWQAGSSLLGPPGKPMFACNCEPQERYILSC